MKKIGSILLLSVFVTMLIMSAWSAGGEIAVIGITGGENTDTATPVQYLIDHDPAIGWISTGNPDGPLWAELRLEEAALIEGLYLYGPWTGELTVEYRQDGSWRSFIAATGIKSDPALPGWNLVDLSYDRIATDRLRLQLTNPGGENQLGGISELKVLGRKGRDMVERLKPVQLTSNRQAEAGYPYGHLFDENTYTAWYVYPAINPEGDTIADLGETCTIRRIKIFGGGPLDRNGIFWWECRFKIQYRQNGAWIDIPGLANLEVKELGAAWTSFDLSAANIQTGQIRIVINNVQWTGGIREVEIWGSRTSPAGSRYIQISQSPLPIGANLPADYSFHLEPAGTPARLHFVTRGGSGIPLAWELNGRNMENLSPVTSIRDYQIYSVTLNSADFSTGANFIRVRRAADQTLMDCRLELNPVRTANAPVTGLTDGWRLTAAKAGEEIINLSGPYHLDELVLQYIGTQPQVLLAIEQNGQWRDLANFRRETAPAGGELIYPVNQTAVRIRVNYGGQGPAELFIRGSRVNDGAPVIKISSPAHGEPVDLHKLSQTVLAGSVDNPDARIVINGLTVTASGTKFEIPLAQLGLPLNAETEIVATATDHSGRYGSDRVSIYIGNFPEFTINLPEEKPTYTQAAGITVTGQVQGAAGKIFINESETPLINKSFQRTVTLAEGLNLITVKVFPSGGGKFARVKTVKVIRTSTAPDLKLLYPLSGQAVNTSPITVSGQVGSLTPVTVTVNGIKATVNNGCFAATVTLKEGGNKLTVKAVDQNGLTSVVEAEVKLDRTPPLLTEVQPPEGAYLNHSAVMVSGKVRDASPVTILVNGIAAAVSSPAGAPVEPAPWTAALSLTEGVHAVKIEARDSAGNTVLISRNIGVDVLPPAEFTPVADPAGWTNNNRPVIRFGTTDSGSGISRYELAADDGPFSGPVSSPYKMPALSDGEHTIKIKATDKAGWETTGSVKVFIDTTPPVAVREFKAVPGDRKIIVSWKPNPETDFKKYILKRTPAFPEGPAEEFGPEITQYTDIEVENFQNYTYSVKALDHIDNTSPAATAATVQPGFAKVTVNPAVETKIEYENVVVGVPAGALPETKTLTVMEIKNPEPLLEQSHNINVSPVYEFSAATSQGPVDPKGVEFEKPVLVGINYKLEGMYQYVKESSLKAYHYNYKNENWEVVPASFVNSQTHTVYFFTTHFSAFSVQASLAPSLSPEQIGGMGASPMGGYSQNNQVGIAYGGGTATVTAKDFVLPGKGGLDLTISRSYDHLTAQSDWGLDEDNVLQAVVGFFDFGNPFFTAFINFMARQLDHALSGPAATYGFGRGWRLNTVWVEKNDNGQFVHLPGGSMKKITWTMDGPGWGGQGHGRFECHAGEHFVLEKEQEKQGDIHSAANSSGNPTKVGESWITKNYTLTTKDGTKYYMDGEGRLLRVVNRLGSAQITFSYNGKQIDYITDSVGRKIDFTYTGNMIASIKGAGKTVTYQYENDELKWADNGGVQRTNYGYKAYTMESASSSISAVSIIQAIMTGPAGWISLVVGMIPFGRSDTVYYLTDVTTPFGGKYTFEYTKYDAVHYLAQDLAYSVIWYDFYKATGLKEIGSAFTKETKVEYNITFANDQAPTVTNCTVTEGKRKTKMVFSRYSNSVDEGASMLTAQMVYGEHDRLISSHAVLEFDAGLEAPTRIVDETGGRRTIQTFAYDNWGNIIRQWNSKTEVEAYYTYANTNAPAINNQLALASPYGPQTIAAAIHDARTGELVLNKNGSKTIAQQTYYKFDPNGNLREKAVRYGSRWLTTGYQYDAAGNVVKMSSPRGTETEFEYSATYQNALLTKVVLKKLTDANGQVRNNLVLREVGYEPETYQKRWEKDARGFVTEYSQDVLGRPVQTVLPDDDDLPEFRPTVLTGAIDRGGHRSNNPFQTNSYDDAGRTTTVTDPKGNRTDYVYDSFEHLVEIRKFKKSLGFIPYVYSRVRVEYDDVGNITAIVSPNGTANPDEAYKYTTVYQYDETNRLKKVIYPDDTAVLADNPYKYYDYNDVANSVTVTDENGHDTLIQKDAVDRVISQDLGLGNEEGYRISCSYDSLGNKVADTDGRNNTTVFEYDDLNQLVKKTLPAVYVLNDPNASNTTSSSPLYSYEYDDEGNLVKEIAPLGSSVIREYDEMNREIRITTSFTVKDSVKKTAVTKTFHDLAGNKVEVIDANGKSTRFEYTARGWLKRKIDLNGGVSSFTYDLVGNKLTETDPRGNMPGAVPNSFTAWYFYDDLYRVVKAVLPDKTPPSDPENPGDNPVIRFEYDYNGNCTTEIKANGQVITYVYDGRNRLVSQSQSLNGKTYTASFEYDGVGNKRFVYDNKGNKTEYVYDALNRLVRIVFPEGNTVQNRYDNNGNIVQVIDGVYNETNSSYDALNRLESVTDGEGNTSHYYYNRDGRMTKQVSANNLVTKFFLNELGMPLRTVDSLGQSRYFDYDAAGNVTYKKDPRGTEARFEYDDMYRVLQSNLQNGSRMQSLSYQYDIVGNVKEADNGQVKLVYNDADGNYDSDPFNRISKVAQVLPDGTRYTTEYQYDIMGQMTGIRYPNSTGWLTYDYDKMGRLIGIPGFAGTKDTPGFTYDDNSALESIKTNNGITTTYQRDDNGRITGINTAKVFGDNILSLTYAFDNANNIIRRNDNSYVYDKVNRLKQATIHGVFEDKFTKADMLMGTADKDYAGTKEPEQDVTELTQVKLDYSARSLILDLQTDAQNICRVELTPEQTGHRVPLDQIEVYYLSGFFYTKLDRSKWVGNKDDQGKITIKFTPILNTNRIKIHCNYDDLNYLQQPMDRAEFYNSPEKLVTVYQKMAARTETYGYDNGGNRLSERILLRKEYGWSYEYYANSNRLKAKVKSDETERIDHTYDLNGNLTSKVVTKGNTVDTWEYAYDLLNQLEQVKKNGVVVSSYVYDPNGFRVEKTGSKGKVHYVPLLNGEVGYKKEFTSGKEFSFVYVGITKLARVDGTIGSSGAKYFYANDHQGSAMVITDKNGNIVTQKDHSPFGTRINSIDDEILNTEDIEDEFTGKEYDEDIGIYYYNARFYDPEIGRFITEDNMADPLNPNEYVYVANNPVNSIDPTGHFTIGGLDKVMSGLSKVGKYMNLLGAIDPKLAKVASAFNSFVNTLSGLEGVKVLYSKISGNYTISYERTVSAADTGIDGVSYKEKVTQTYKKNKLVASETTQMFMSDAGEVTIVTKNSDSDGFSQTYTFVSSDKSNTVDKTITFKSGEEGDKQTNIITTEGFINTNKNNFTDDPFGALMIATTKQGAIGAWQGSSLPNKSAYATIAETTGEPLIMTKMHHKGDPTLYAAVGVNMTADLLWKTPTEGLNPYPGKLDDQGKVIPGTANPNYNTPFATGIEIHSGDSNTNRGSMGCQTVKPGLNGANWNEFSNAMKLDSLKDGAFIGYYYLVRP